MLVTIHSYNRQYPLYELVRSKKHWYQYVWYYYRSTFVSHRADPINKNPLCKYGSDRPKISTNNLFDVR